MNERDIQRLQLRTTGLFPIGAVSFATIGFKGGRTNNLSQLYSNDDKNTILFVTAAQQKRSRSR